MDEWRSKNKKEKKSLEPIPNEGMEWLEEEWDGEIKEEKRKPDENKVIKNKRMKLDPLVDWGEKADIAAPCVRTWLLMDSIHEEEDATDWRLKLPSPQQEPSQKLKQMEWNFGQKFAPVPVEDIPTKKAGKPKTGKLTKKEQKELFTTNQKLSWGKADMSSQLDQEEVVINIKSQPTGQSIPNNKLINHTKRAVCTN